MASFLLVHSPLVGPAPWSWVAEELRGRGHHAAVPSMVEAAASGRWEACVDAAAAAGAAPGPVVVAGPSGAGPLLPAIAGRLDPRRRGWCSSTPPCRPPAGAPRWSPSRSSRRWPASPPTASSRRGPSGSSRGPSSASSPTAGGGTPCWPRSRAFPSPFLLSPVSVPARWADRACAYVLLSDLDLDGAAEAAARGWPVVELPGGHLDPVARPGPLAGALAGLAP